MASELASKWAKKLWQAENGESMEQFVEHFQQAIDEAVAAERDRCAKLAENLAEELGSYKQINDAV